MKDNEWPGPITEEEAEEILFLMKGRTLFDAADPFWSREDAVRIYFLLMREPLQMAEFSISLARGEIDFEDVEI